MCLSTQDGRCKLLNFAGREYELMKGKQMSTETNDSGALYFIVGMLLVGVLVLGFIYLDAGDIDTPAENNTTVIERTIDRTVETDNEPDSSFNLDVREDGFSASTESN